jgi:dimethylhistidine N-methyltransferase
MSDSTPPPGSAAASPAADAPDDRADFVQAVRFYLQQEPRQLPSRFLYDGLGSALFDAICHLPWYRVTRAELRLLREHARTIGQALGRRGRVVELGPGNGDKLAALLANAGVPDVHAHLIDVSRAALGRAVQTLATVTGVTIRTTTQEATYEDALLSLPAAPDAPTLIAFLGSNIGNFDRPAAIAMLRSIRAALRPGDALLLGVDLVKPAEDLLLAYDDPLGVTAAFNKNLLVRLNAELGADFQLPRFSHRAVWNAAASRVEMHLVSLVDQPVTVDACELRFTLRAGETIWTESSYKFDPDALGELVEPAGFRRRRAWIDQRARFALALYDAI